MMFDPTDGLAENFNEAGQTLIEFVFCSVLAVTAVTGASLLVRDAWNRSRCAYLIFEATHQARIGTYFRATGHVDESSDRFVGEGTCGYARERVSLPKLETARW